MRSVWVLSLVACLGQSVSGWNHAGAVQLQAALDSSAYTLIACKQSSKSRLAREVS